MSSDISDNDNKEVAKTPQLNTRKIFYFFLKIPRKNACNIFKNLV